MKLDEIKAAVRSGKKVHWATDMYDVTLGITKQGHEHWSILCTANQNCIGLTHRDEVTMNGKEEDFYVEGEC